MHPRSSQPPILKVRPYTRRQAQLDPNPSIPGPPANYESFRADMAALTPQTSSFTPLVPNLSQTQRYQPRWRPVQTAESFTTREDAAKLIEVPREVRVSAGRSHIDPTPTIPAPPRDHELYRADTSAWIPPPISFSALVDPDFPHKQPRLRKRHRKLVQTAESSATPQDATNLNKASQIAQFARRPQLELNPNILMSPANPESYQDDTPAKSSHRESQQHKPQWQPVQTTETFAAREDAIKLKSNEIKRTTFKPAAPRAVAKPTFQANIQNPIDSSHDFPQKPAYNSGKRDARGQMKLGETRILQPLPLATNVHRMSEMQPAGMPYYIMPRSQHTSSMTTPYDASAAAGRLNQPSAPRTQYMNSTLYPPYPYPYPYQAPPYALVPARWAAPGSATILAHAPKRPSFPGLQAEPKRAEKSTANSNPVFPHAPTAKLTSPAEKDLLAPPTAYPTLALLLADLNRLLCTPHASQAFQLFRGTCAGVGAAREDRAARVVDIAWEIIATTVLSFDIHALKIESSPSAAVATAQSSAIWMGAPSSPEMNTSPCDRCEHLLTISVWEEQQAEASGQGILVALRHCAT
ncbi:hypothetical protein DFH06DRAFT_1173422 [Mycena polygramma]|nr:hypothetical protein DFH06DRAFT_1173422 [Mycena polygramma]